MEECESNYQKLITDMEAHRKEVALFAEAQRKIIRQKTLEKQSLQTDINSKIDAKMKEKKETEKKIERLQGEKEDRFAASKQQEAEKEKILNEIDDAKKTFPYYLSKIELLHQKLDGMQLKINDNQSDEVALQSVLRTYEKLYGIKITVSKACVTFQFHPSERKVTLQALDGIFTIKETSLPSSIPLKEYVDILNENRSLLGFLEKVRSAV